MSVNIFGAAAGAGRISHDNFYIDQKFKTLSTNLTTKLNKSGDKMTGDLLLNSAELRTFGVSGITTGHSTSFLLGDVENQIRHNYGHSIKITASNGVKFTSPAGEVCQMGKHSDANLFMNNNRVTGVRDPERAQDAATKKYVDNRKNYNGYIPILESNISCLGFSASSSATSSTRHQPYGAFNNLNADGSNGCWVTPQTVGWIQIRCPEQVKIWRIAVKSRAGRDITSWNLSASNDGTAHTLLLNSTTALLGSLTAPTFIEVTANNAYQYYRLTITESSGSTDVGVQVFQLYIIG
jgi:hypothetical protein